MRHKYQTEALVLARYPLKEAGALTTLLTKDFGIVAARAEGVKRSGAKLAHALQTLTHSRVTLVRGKEGWRLTGATLQEDCFSVLTRAARLRAARICSLLIRFSGPDAPDARVFEEYSLFLSSLTRASDEEQDAAETLMALRLLSYLGFDAGTQVPVGYTETSLSYAQEHRKELIERINKGIIAAGL